MVENVSEKKAGITMQELERELKEAFYWFHRHPELSYEEYETTKKIREFLAAHDIEILPYEPETGLIAIIRGEKDGAVQALRCDIDALPIEEKTDLAYRSEIQGKMHACGHDMHITAGLGCAVLLQQRKSTLQGNVKIIFQPAEETSLGSLKILETDVMEDVSRIWGFHADPTNAVGTIGIREGYVTAAVDRFVITVKGVGCHGAHPDDGIDPIVVSAAIIQALQSIVSRNVNAFHPSLLSVTRINAGTTWNVIPAQAVMEGTVRTMEREDRILYERKIQEIAVNTAKAYGAEAQVEWIAGSPATYNDKEMADFCARKAKESGMNVVLEESSLGGDDFSFYEEKIPGCYLKVGTGIGHPIHHPAFLVNPDVLYTTAGFLTELLLSV
ncbi:MAG: amidohydrolase [Bacillus sp. (in: Bacteria)]|nr:amidohydrolase [Bacillus sp. (in: firmicutes)]MCM1425324.1 amidohydrolase [Eubacterium sp.]